jgi:acyl-CoA synthetase (AMP-forming)/AMP-acid ligase II
MHNVGRKLAVQVRGPGVMNGCLDSTGRSHYYNDGFVDEQASDEAQHAAQLSQELYHYRQYQQQRPATSAVGGWFDTGDMGYVVPPSPWHQLGGYVVLTGRAKDTIVLSWCASSWLQIKRRDKLICLNNCDSASTATSGN